MFLMPCNDKLPAWQRQRTIIIRYRFWCHFNHELPLGSGRRPSIKRGLISCFIIRDFQYNLARKYDEQCKLVYLFLLPNCYRIQVTITGMHMHYICCQNRIRVSMSTYCKIDRHFISIKWVLQTVKVYNNNIKTIPEPCQSNPLPYCRICESSVWQTKW